MEAVKRFLHVVDTPNSELTLRQKCTKVFGYIAVGILGYFLVVLIRKQNNSKNEKQKARNKLKYFKPIIEEGMFSNKTTWVMRDTPLKEEELDEFFKTFK